MRRLVSSAVNSIQLSNRGSKTVREVFRKWLTTGKMTQRHTWREYRQYALQNGGALLRDYLEYSKGLQWLLLLRVGG
ncbi:hypothetical protein GAYE_HTGSCF06PCTG21G0263 [Galdieria yellowstonensis]|uniref:Uncharacterized protein n=1 Tax=Galdieria yellowstonensis TaxID=3028027 RepID=A0AAV9I4P9_9RHOD|nr:hypothetical protein GAYE_HTGSCF06PCTG21G0263 [Galdieria yellowstonensis]